MLGKELLVATSMVILVVFVHLMGLALLWRALRSHTKVFSRLRILPLTLLLTATLGLILLHTVDIWLYAALYLYLGVFRTLEQSLYFSTVTYSSLGYGDVLLPNEWRLLGAIECPAGIILLGISTAFFFTVLTKFRLLGHDWLSGDEHGGDH